MGGFQNHFEKKAKKEAELAAVPEVLLSEKIYRPGAKAKIQDVNFVLTRGGIGDFLCWFSALKYIEDFHFQVRGTIWAADYMLELVEYFFKDKWEIKDRANLTTKILNGTPSYIPQTHSVINGVGSNLVDLGFIYFANRSHAPIEYKNHLQFNFSPEQIGEIRDKFNLPEKYSIMTPGSTEYPRTMRPYIFNRITEFLNDNDSKPVCLGKRLISKQGRKAKIDDDYDLRPCISLLDQTTLLEAAIIIAGAETINGLDNGLLHLGAMTPTPLVFGYTVIGPEFRRPSRPLGGIYDVYPSRDDLSCIGCMANMRYFFNHDFKNCIFKDLKCLDVIGKNNGQLWIDQLEKALKESRNGIRNRR